jgi:predicted signal transduction protein with EAL and GGDEF domain
MESRGALGEHFAGACDRGFARRASRRRGYLAPRQLLDRALLSTVATALNEAGLHPSTLCLEITEGSAIQDFDAALPVLNALRTLGVWLALDDFDTGYSSLSYLKRLPVTSVKIDQSFVSELDGDTGECEIARAIIGLAHTMGLSVTAEGVETMALPPPIPERMHSRGALDVVCSILRIPAGRRRSDYPAARPIRPASRSTDGALAAAISAYR